MIKFEVRKTSHLSFGVFNQQKQEFEYNNFSLDRANLYADILNNGPELMRRVMNWMNERPEVVNQRYSIPQLINQFKKHVGATI